MKPGNKFHLFTLFVLCFSGFYLVGQALPPSEGKSGMHLAAAGRLPVLDGGRVMPLDTVARNALMIVSGRQTYVDASGETQPAVQWLFNAMTSPRWRKGEGPALKDKVFRIENDQVLSLLELKPRTGDDAKKWPFRYSLEEIMPRFDAFLEQLQRVKLIPADDRDLYDNKIVELEKHLGLVLPMLSYQRPSIIPPSGKITQWRSLLAAAQEDAHAGHDDSAVFAYAEMLQGYQTGKAEEFNAAVAKIEDFIRSNPQVGAGKVGFEEFFNRFAPFYNCAALYVLVLILACCSWVTFPQQFHQAALALACLVLGLHCYALFGRMYIMGRPLVFVTNLYSSAVFIGWIGVMLGVTLEFIFKNSIGLFVASVTGVTTLIIGHFLAISGEDTLGMMQAVLDTNFWLATHVTSVTIGYSSTFVAGILGIVVVVLRVVAPAIYKQNIKSLGSMIYGIVSFAMLFSFVGTVLGGIWADQSWGRFWGWDPKENGALLIVIWNALILHARWGGMVQQRGMAVLAIGGNIMTAWSWFGVNMLGVGLHNYGFIPGHLFWMLTWMGFNLVAIAVGLIPAEWLTLWNTPASATSSGFGNGSPTPSVQNNKSQPVQA